MSTLIKTRIVLDEKLQAGETKTFDLERYLPLGKVESTNVERIELYQGGRWSEASQHDDLENHTARYIRFTARNQGRIRVHLGQGYIAKKDEAWRAPFNRRSNWTGGDGIFSFNIKNGRDTYDQKDARTLFVFGDTLVGKSDPETRKRLKPLLMPNNTIAYLEGNDIGKATIDFRIATDADDAVTSFFSPDNPSVYEGTPAQNLVTYSEKDLLPFISGNRPKKLEVIFDFGTNRHVDAMTVHNHFPESPAVAGRAVKKFVVSVSLDKDKWLRMGEHTLRLPKKKNDGETFALNKRCRYVKIAIPPVQGEGNHYPPDEGSEVLFALDKVEFQSGGQRLENIIAESSSVLAKKKRPAWFWLQDGVVIGDAIYFLPLLVVPDEKKPEGLQFAVKGVNIMEVPFQNGELDFPAHTQRPAPLYRKNGDKETIFGAAIMNNTAAAGVKHPDGHIYIYGYTFENGGRSLKVARTKPGRFTDVDEWRFFANGEWVADMDDATPVLDHISCEMSVSPIETGAHEGGFLAVFQYDVNTDHIAYSIGETPWGPFTEPRIVYECEEPKQLGRSTYAYNAKAHPHLSRPDSILVSYNVNTYDMQHHYDNVEVYHPRFVRLVDTTTDAIAEEE